MISMNIGIFLIIVGIIILLIIGINMAATITDTLPYLLFWLMYIISIATVVNIGMTVYYYYIMKDKRGPRGKPGPRGDMGDVGKSGQCSIGCRNKICEKSIKDTIVEIINKKEREDGVMSSDFTDEDIRNVYIKEKIKTMCQSPEFQQLVPYKGANNLISYLASIWGKMTELIYDSGGLNYFKSIGAENDWDWLEYNPWSEFKKYDIYYWGLSKDYRPQLVEKCDTSKLNTANLFDGSKYPEKRHLSSDYSTDNYKEPSKKSSKYSILEFINSPNNVNLKIAKDGVNSYTNAFSDVNNNQIKLYNAFIYKPSAEIQQKYEAGNSVNKARPLKPMSYLVGHYNKDGKCAAMNNSGSIFYKTCNPYDTQQIFTLTFDNKKENKMKKFTLAHTDTKNEIGINNTKRVINKRNMGDLFKFK
jgi:hypothetical protein